MLVRSEINRDGMECGTSLVELLLATTVVMTIVVAVLMGTIRHSSQRQHNVELNLATLAALDTLEEMRSVPFADLPTLHKQGFDVPDATGAPGGLEALPGDGDGLPGAIEVTLELSTGTVKAYRVTATVEWTGVQRTNRVFFRQLFAERK